MRFYCTPLVPFYSLSEFTLISDADDINIDEPLVVRFSPKTSKNENEGIVTLICWWFLDFYYILHLYFDIDEGKRSEKEKLFEGASTDSHPKMRTAEEIKAKYRKVGVLVMMIWNCFYLSLVNHKYSLTAKSLSRVLLQQLKKPGISY